MSVVYEQNVNTKPYFVAIEKSRPLLPVPPLVLPAGAPNLADESYWPPKTIPEADVFWGLSITALLFLERWKAVFLMNCTCACGW
jgi:hypothetical protein